MQAIDYLKAAGVAVAIMLITLLASYPMVAFYAWFIEPGQAREFYVEAAQWIAPWSSWILGPLLFAAFNFWMARRTRARNAQLFAAASIVLYVVIDFGMLPALGVEFSAVLTWTMAFSLGVKYLGASLGAWLGQRGGARS